MSLNRIIRETNLPYEEIREVIYKLLNKNYLKQDSRDRVRWFDRRATFYTNPLKRGEIDKIICNTKEFHG